MPRVVFISDTHLRHKFEVPEGDILVHAGDLTGHGDIHNNEVARAMKWFGSLPHQHKIFCAGNHDFLFHRNPDVALPLVPENVTYLQDSEVTVMGIRIYGSPWSPWFFDWAFNRERGEDIAEVWSLIPEGIDVLITHGPPMGILDKTPPHNGRLGQHVGCEELLARIQVVKPRVHVFGHIHGGHGRVERDGTTFINASICNEQYQATQPAFVMDL